MKCHSCGAEVGEGISQYAADEIIRDRELLTVQKRDLVNKVERQAAWIEKLERMREAGKAEAAALRARLSELEGRTVFEPGRGHMAKRR